MDTTQLAFKRTNFANDRTFLASIRTNAIFAGLSLLLVKNNYPQPAIIILLLSIGANVIIIKSYLKNKKNESYKASSLIYSSILILVLVILLYITIIEYKNLK
tara:strand:- start:840 stop:1148 length:309 start_codon:yes stop_codon:yes gene_type:complete